MRTLVALVVAAGCGSKKSGAPPGDGGVTVSGDGGAAVSGPADARTSGPSGEVTIKVEWKDAPIEARQSPGRDPCGNARPPAARIHTLHGVAGVAVWIDDGVAARADAPARLALRDCQFEPAVQVAAVGAELRLSLLDDGPAAADVRFSDAMDRTPDTTVARLVLPVVGHTVAFTLDRPGLVAIVSEAAGDPAYVVVTPHAHAAVTDEAGAAVFTGVPAGPHAVSGWRPGGLLSGTVDVPDKGDVEVTLPVAP